MTYRVIQWSTGNVGRHALRLHRAPSRPRARRRCGCTAPTRPGKDAGELAGIDPIGVLATNDVDALLALDADCVCYTATADLRPAEAIADMARILASGKNIVSSSVVPLVYPPHVDPAMRAPLEDACATGGRVVLHVGHRSRVGRTTCCRSCSPARASTSTQLRVMEIVNYATYAQPTVLFDTMGFGQALDATPLLLIPGVLSFAWGGTVKVLAAGLGVELDELREVHERQPAPRDDRPRLRRRRRRARPRRCASRCRASSTASRASSSSTSPASTTTLAPDWPQPVGHSGYRVDRHRQPELHRATCR